MAVSARRIRRHRSDDCPLPTRFPMTWQPTELPDLRRVDEMGFDIETKDDGLSAGIGSSWPWRGGYIVGVNVAWRREGGMHANYFPIAHPDSDNFDREQV